MDNIQLLTVILVIVVGIIAMLLVILGMVFFYSKMKNKTDSEVKDSSGKDKDKKLGKSKKFREYKTESIMNFLEFDTVVDNMISQKDGMRYIMVVECQGINYDLMSQVEKNAV